MRDDAYWRVCCHESGHALAQLLLLGELPAVSIKSADDGTCICRWPSGIPANEHRWLVAQALTTASGMASEALVLPGSGRSLAKADLADLASLCEELSAVSPIYKASMAALMDLFETSSRTLLADHTHALESLAHELYAKQAWHASDLYGKLTARYPRYKEDSYVPLLAGPDWLARWSALLGQAEQRPDDLAEWRGQDRLQAKYETLQAQHRALALTLARDVD